MKFVIKMLSEVDPKWRFNTSKKISQLTKVVFRLHSNSMDHRDSAVELKERYEDEIGDILSESKKWLENASKESESFHPTIESVVMKEFENKYDQTKAQFESAKKKIQTQTEKMIQNATSQLNSIRLQLDEIKKKSINNQNEYPSIVDQINQLTEKLNGQMQGNRKKFIDRLIAEANAKYDATLQITQKKEQEMREKYESENENLRKMLESSKISAEDTLNQNLKTISDSIIQISNDRNELTDLVKKFSEQSENFKTDIQKVFVVAESIRDKIIENQKKELISFQAQLQKLKEDQESEIKNLKDIISSEQSSFNQAYSQKVKEYENYDQISKQKVAEYEELAKKATEEAELKNQQLIKDNNEVLEKCETAKIQFIDNEHEKSHLINQKILEIHKKHQQKVTEIREQIDKQLDDYLLAFEKTINEHQNELNQMKEENKNHFENQQKKLLENSKDDSNELKNMFIQKAKLKNSYELSKFEFKRDSENIENEKNREMTIIQRQHETKMSYLDHEFDCQIKEIDEKLNASFEKEKKQFLINMKFAEERSNIDIKHTIESKKNEIESKRQELLDVERDKNESELSTLTQEIEEKTIDKKAIDLRLQNDLVEHNTKLAEMQKEVKSMEQNWVTQKQKYLQNWNEKFDKIKNQLTEEEKQNEDMRKFDESRCQQIVYNLKSELQEEEENGVKKLNEIQKLIDEEKKKNDDEINRLNGEINKLTTNRESSVVDLEKKLNTLKVERENLIKEENEKKMAEIQSENDKLKELRKTFQKETCDLKSSLVEKSNEYEKEILDLKIKYEQSQLDFDYLIEEFQRKKNLELQIIENKNQYEIEMLTIELVRLQNETDRISEEGKKNMDSLKDLEKECNENLEKESKSLSEKIEKENKKKIEEKQKIISELNSKINDIENDKKKQQQPRLKDLEQISCLEEVLNERIEASEMLDELIKKYEAFFIEHELHFSQLKEGKQPPKIQDIPTIVAPITQTSSKKLKREKMPSVFASQRKMSSIKEYSTPNRKNKVIV